jgi:hypothetical protein
LCTCLPSDCTDPLARQHYHGDPFGGNCLYSCANYSTLASHPPLIAYGADGIPVFGRYLSASAPGANVSLDYCGGHTHSGIGDAYITDNSYHYHAFVSTINAGLTSSFTSYSFTAYTNGPYMCFKGNLSTFWNKGFWVGNQTSYGAGNIQQRSDYAFIKPCSGNTNAYVAPGFTINNIVGSGFNYSSTWPPTAGPGTTGGACAAIQTGTSSPPPSPPPPSPSPAAAPTPAAVANSVVTSAVTLSGYTVATFGTAQAAAFKSIWASYLNVPTTAVVITNVANAAGSGRHLSTTGVQVTFAVTLLSASAATAAVTALTTYPASALATIQAGLPLVTSAPVVATLPTTGSTVPPDVSSGLGNTTPPPSSSAATVAAGKAATALLAGALALLA